jgi:DNA-binding response OmpR family regulator
MTEAKKILIVDDDRDYADTMRLVLENSRFHVRHASTIGQARDLIAGDRPDLIVLDVMMEKHTDGFDFCAELKQDPSLSAIPVLIITSVTRMTGFKFSPETDGEYCRADDYAAKPVAMADLLARVERLLGLVKQGSCKGI